MCGSMQRKLASGIALFGDSVRTRVYASKSILALATKPIHKVWEATILQNALITMVMCLQIETVQRQAGGKKLNNQ